MLPFVLFAVILVRGTAAELKNNSQNLVVEIGSMLQAKRGFFKSMLNVHTSLYHVCVAGIHSP